MVVSAERESKRVDDETLARWGVEVAERCLREGTMLATAESCTGGWIAKCLTDIAGSSRWFAGGVVSYSNAAKSDILGVSAALTETHGAVSGAVARAMAEGALRVFRVDRAVAVTGIAGPGGGTAAKPVGTVWFAWAACERPTMSECRHFGSDRETVRRKAVAYALEGVLASMETPRFQSPTSPEQGD